MKPRESSISISLPPALPVAAVWIALMMVGGATLAAAQTETVIHRFQNQYHGGLNPSGGLVADKTGALYGTAALGGKSVLGLSYGAVYKLSPPSTTGGTWQDKVLYSFTGGADGEYPYGGVLLNAKAGKIYGTAGSVSGYGLVYQLTPGSPWTESVLYSFSGPDGSSPNGGLISDANGALYGTTSNGGAVTCNGGSVGCGVVYKLTPPSAPGGIWTEQVLYNFQGGNDGWDPSSGVILDKSGALYGTTFYGGPNNGGTVYKLTPPSGGSGAYTESMIHAFNGAFGSPEGAYPIGALTFDSAGALYGTTNNYGQYGWGNVFKLTLNGGVWTETFLHQFTGGSDGAVPAAALVFDSAGALYGTTVYGGDVNSNDACSYGQGDGYYGCGTVFKLTPPSTQGGSWTETVLHTFTNFEGFPGAPVLLLGKNLYGTTPAYGSDTMPAPGTAFQIKQ